MHRGSRDSWRRCVDDLVRRLSSATEGYGKAVQEYGRASQARERARRARDKRAGLASAWENNVRQLKRNASASATSLENARTQQRETTRALRDAKKDLAEADSALSQADRKAHKARHRLHGLVREVDSWIGTIKDGVGRGSPDAFHLRKSDGSVRFRGEADFIREMGRQHQNFFADLLDHIRRRRQAAMDAIHRSHREAAPPGSNDADKLRADHDRWFAGPEPTRRSRFGDPLTFYEDEGNEPFIKDPLHGHHP